MIAIGARLDLLGVAVIAFVMGLGGGLMRDVLLGALPPAALRDQRYAAVVLAAALATLALRRHLQGPMADMLLVLDAAGLALSAVAGTQKSLDAGLGPVAAVIAGTVTATGGGVLRDILLVRVPAVLRVDFYATAALAGAVLIVAARRAGLSARLSATIGGLACLGLRLVGARLHWHLPVVE